MAERFDPQEMVTRFRQRAQAVKERGLPPVEGPERQRLRTAGCGSSTRCSTRWARSSR